MIGEEINIIKYEKSIMALPLPNNEFELLEATCTSWSNNDKPYRIVIPTGFKWDGATIPRFLWSVFGYYPAGIMLAASCIHDYIYINKGWIYNTITKQYEFISRKHSDKLFYKHLLESGVKQSKAKQAYQIIRLFGRFYWSDFSDFNPFKNKAINKH